MFYISDDKNKLQSDRIMYLLAQTYWAQNRTEEQVKISIENSVCFGVYDEKTDEQIGFARVITDYSTTYYICDVIVDKDHRENGIGKALIKTITTDDRFSKIFGMLITGDAHGLYSRYGFEVDSEHYMKRTVK